MIAILMMGCERASGALRPQGPAAARIADSWWIMLGLAGAIFALVMGLLLFALFRPRRADERPAENPSVDRRLVIGGGVVLPLVVLSALFSLTVRDTIELSVSDQTTALTIEVIGHQWWWELRYPADQFTTANELHIPVGQTVRIDVSTVDVIHSYWAPELHGKIDMLPGTTNTFWMKADRVGKFRGMCAEFCGLQHALMAFLVIAESAEEFEQWREQQRKAATIPTEPEILRGQQVFRASKCAECHTVRGTDAISNKGPELTHFASRQTIAAGTLPNSRGHLAGWILDPQNVKWGNAMPPTDLSGAELQALLAYLESLK